VAAAGLLLVKERFMGTSLEEQASEWSVKEFGGCIIFR
jgi:hypothetical protein